MPPRRHGTAPKQCVEPLPRTPKSTTTKETSDSQDSVPLSDPYTATHIVDGGKHLVGAPEGASHLSIYRRSTRLAAQTTAETPAPTKVPANLSIPRDILSRNSPVGKKTVGWRYDVSDGGPSTTKGDSRTPGDLPGNVDGPRNINAAPAGPNTRKNVPIGRKRAATSEAPGSNSRAKGPLASSRDFPDDFWVEPPSDNAENLLLRSPARITETRTPRLKTSEHAPTGPTSSPMKVDLPDPKGKSKSTVTPVSSPISHNPLLVKRDAKNPLSPQIPNIQNANADWLYSHNLVPVGNNINAPGYVSGGT
jgi:hypothetical protein